MRNDTPTPTQGNVDRRRPYLWDTPTRALTQAIPSLPTLPGKPRALMSSELHHDAPRSFTGGTPAESKRGKRAAAKSAAIRERFGK